MNFQELYESKKVSLDEALVLEKRIQPGVQFTLSVRLAEA